MTVPSKLSSYANHANGIIADVSVLPHTSSSLSEKLDIDNYVKGVSSVVVSTNRLMLNVACAPLVVDKGVWGIPVRNRRYHRVMCS